MSAHEIIRSLLHSKLELQDSTNLEVFWFTESHRVIATLGTRGEAVCGPILKYSINDDETVEIGDSSESLFYRWERLQLTDDELVVVCDGMTKRFTITKPPKKERWLP